VNAEPIFGKLIDSLCAKEITVLQTVYPPPPQHWKNIAEDFMFSKKQQKTQIK